jgi:AcrR family transcriptional regulator
MNKTRIKNGIHLNRSLLSRKERERKARREEIIQAARDLFILKGYHETTLDEIAQHAEFGKGTIYNYFSSKEELFLAIIDKLSTEMIQLAQSSIRMATGGTREKLKAYARAMITYSHANSDVYHMVLREIHRLNNEQHDARLKTIKSGFKKVWMILARTLSTDMKRGRIKMETPLKVAALFDSMIRFYHIDQFERSQPLKNSKIDEAVTLIISVFFDGISARKIKG